MHVRSVRLRAIKRFTDLAIEVGSQPQLVMVCGPNGTGKSSLFDALRWGTEARFRGYPHDPEYWTKVPGPDAPEVRLGPTEQIEVSFHEPPETEPEPRKLVYARTAYRNEPQFALGQLHRSGSVYDAPRVERMIDNDARVSDNYQRLIGKSIDTLYGGAEDDRTVRDIREGAIGQLRRVLQGVFPDLELIGPGDPLSNGTFRFRKGTSSGFAYLNLSGGEKAVFDLLLDLMVKQDAYDNTVFCIDEPEAHTNARVQAAVLDAMLEFINERSQLWLATHSIGMLRRAREIQSREPDRVVFIDFDADFDEPQVLRPATVDRAFWRRTLDVAFGDVADLVAPAQVVLCEGEPVGAGRADFDARCLKIIFGDTHPDTEFLGVGNDVQVQSDERGIGRAVEALAPGTQVHRLIDRDDRSDQDIAEARRAGVRVLSRRHLEAYLLDPEVLQELCEARGASDLWPQVWQEVQQANAASIERSNPVDDWKSCAGEIFNACRRILRLAGAGNSKDSFMRDTLAPLIDPSMAVYAELRRDVFDE